MKNIVFVILLISISSHYTQKIWVKGIISDQSSEKTPIPDVKIFTSSNPKHPVITNSKGYYQIEVEAFKSNDTIYFNHTGFENTYKIITPNLVAKLSRKEVKHYELNLTLNYQVLGGYTFVAKKVDTVFGSEKVSVEDFLLQDDGKMVLMVYEKTKSKGTQILYVDENQQEISSAHIPGNALHLFEDYAGLKYVVCEQKVLQINIVKDQIRFLDVSQEDFYGFHHRVIDTIGTKYYYSNFTEIYPAVKFIVTEKNDSTHLELLEVKDQFMMELYRAQYKYVSGRDKLWAYRKEQETGIDKEIWIGAASFTHDILYEPVYAPLFVKNDTVHIFDQYKSFLYKFDVNNDLVDSVKINYFKQVNKEKWEQPLLKDKISHEIFALYDKGGYNYLKLIDCQHGKTSTSFKLSNRFVSQVKVMNGYVYYIYRPYESLQKKFLYKEKLIFEE